MERDQLAGHGVGAIEVDGLVLAHVDGQALRLAYRIRCDADWTTRHIEVIRHGVPPVVAFESDG